MKMYLYSDVKHNVYTVSESFLPINTPKPMREVSKNMLWKRLSTSEHNMQQKAYQWSVSRLVLSKKLYFPLPQKMFLLVLKRIFKSNPYSEYDYSDEFNLNISNVYEYVILRQLVLFCKVVMVK
jgi:hypothetical protein